jgi:hypothetical protein
MAVEEPMMKKLSPSSPHPEQSTREVERHALLEEALRNPGVADVVRVYGDLAKFQVGIASPLQPKLQYATDANG